MVILINKFTLSTTPEKFEEVFTESSVFMRNAPGFCKHTLVRSLRSPNVYINIAEWTDVESHQRVVHSEGFQAHVRELAEVARVEPDLYSVVFDIEAF